MLNKQRVGEAGRKQSDCVRALYQQASQDEADFKAVLEGLGYRITESTTEEDRFDDIDMWIHNGDQRRGISLKTTRFREGRVPLELTQWIWRGQGEAPRRGYESQSERKDAWFYTSKCDVFAFECFGVYYLVDAVKLRELINKVFTKTELLDGRKSKWFEGDRFDISYLNPATNRNNCIADSLTCWFTPAKHQSVLLGVISKESREVLYVIGDEYDASRL